jgi:exosome complex exonuclease DIS3/RRP44
MDSDENIANELIAGVFTIDSVNYYKQLNAHVNDIPITSFEQANKALDGDIVEFDQESNKIVNIIERHNIDIAGTLHLSSNVTMGSNHKSVPLKMFTPNNHLLPSFLVATKKQKQSSDVYCVIKFKEWVDKYPVGNLHIEIGNVGDDKAEYDYLLYKHGMKWAKLTRPLKTQIENVMKNNKELSLNGRLDLRDKNIISIDPIGCKDIDDAIHVEQIDKDTCQLGIHIADVSHYIAENTPFDELISGRGFSIYLPHKRIDMISEKLATNHCSLRQDEDKYAMSLLVKFNTTTNEIIEYSFHKSIICNSRAMSYEDANNLLFKRSKRKNVSKVLVNDIMKLFEISKIYYESKKKSELARLFGHIDGEFDSHKMVEVYMIMANVLSAQFMRSNRSHAILRKHSGLKEGVDVIESKSDSQDEGLNGAIMYMNRLNVSRAQYICVSKESDDDTFHQGLNEVLYTHFTSPIRRYPDILVHRLLLNDNPDNISIISSKLEAINDIQKKINKVQIESSRLHLMFQLIEEGIESFETDGYVVGFNSEGKNHKVDLYLPEHDIQVSVTPFSIRLQHLIKFDVNDSMYSVEYNDKLFVLNILNNVKVRVVVTIKDKKLQHKLKIQLVSPDPLEFLK